MQNTIKLQEIYNTTLEMSFTAEDLYTNHINNTKYKEIILDFTGITFMSLSFTQEYVYQKTHCNKKIIETNMHHDIKPMLELVEKRNKIKK